MSGAGALLRKEAGVRVCPSAPRAPSGMGSPLGHGLRRGEEPSGGPCPQSGGVCRGPASSSVICHPNRGVDKASKWGPCLWNCPHAKRIQGDACAGGPSTRQATPWRRRGVCGVHRWHPRVGWGTCIRVGSRSGGCRGPCCALSGPGASPPPCTPPGRSARRSLPP